MAPDLLESCEDSLTHKQTTLPYDQHRGALSAEGSTMPALYLSFADSEEKVDVPEFVQSRPNPLYLGRRGQTRHMNAMMARIYSS